MPVKIGYKVAIAPAESRDFAEDFASEANRISLTGNIFRIVAFLWK
jgi:hypothetical protein